MADVTGAGVGDGRVMRGATEEDVEGGRRGRGRRGDQLDGGRGVSGISRCAIRLVQRLG